MIKRELSGPALLLDFMHKRFRDNSNNVYQTHSQAKTRRWELPLADIPVGTKRLCCVFLLTHIVLRTTLAGKDKQSDTAKNKLKDRHVHVIERTSPVVELGVSGALTAAGTTFCFFFWFLKKT